MTNTETLIDYFTRHPLRLSYTISDEGVIHATVPLEYFTNIPDYIRTIWYDLNCLWVIRIGYSGYYNGCRHDEYWKRPDDRTHLHRDYEYIEYGALQKHYYEDSNGNPLPDQPCPNSPAIRTNPSTPTNWRQLPIPVARLSLEDGLDATYTSDPQVLRHYYFRDDLSTYYTFQEWRERRRELDIPYRWDPKYGDYTYQTWYRFSMNLCVTLTARRDTAEGSCDWPLACFSYPMTSWETYIGFYKDQPSKWIRL